MVKVENHCCDCNSSLYPCEGERCELRDVRQLYCDRCGDAVDVLYKLDDADLCKWCVLDSLEEVRL
jgi:hypothetical protein